MIDIEGCKLCPRQLCGSPVREEISKRYFAVVGESPKDEDDLMGEPFMSREGVYVRKLFDSVGIHPYYTFLAKCGTHKPSIKDIRVCSKWIEKELAVVCPTYVVSLGKTASAILTQSSLSKFDLAEQRGRLFSMGSYNVVCWDSAFAMLNSGKKSEREFVTLIQGLKDEILAAKNL